MATYSIYNLKINNTLSFNPGLTTGNILSVNNNGSTTWISPQYNIDGTINITSSIISLNLNNPNLWTSGQAGRPYNYTSAPTFNLDFATANNFTIGLTGNAILGVPLNAKAGQSGAIYVYQDSVGSRILSYAWPYQFSDGIATTLTTTSYAKDMIPYYVDRSQLNTVTISIASPCVISYNSHGLRSGDIAQLTTTSGLPKGMTANTTYFVFVTGSTGNLLNIASSLSNLQDNSFIVTTGTQAGTHSMNVLSITLGYTINIK